MHLGYLVLPITFMTACAPQVVSRPASHQAQVDIALQVFATIQPVSLRENVEYCGTIGVDRRGQIVASGAARGIFVGLLQRIAKHGRCACGFIGRY